MVSMTVDDSWDRHEFLFRNEPHHNGKPHEERIKAIILLRDYLESLPSYSGSFTNQQVCQGYDVSKTAIIPVVHHFVGSWSMPEVFGGGGKNKNWVNPNYKDVRRYAEVAVKCECGASIVKSKNTGGRSAFDNENEHNDDCLLEDRIRATADLIEHRRIVMERQALLGHTARSLCDRLGTHRNDVSHFADQLGLDYYGLRQRGYRLREQTIVDLVPDYSPKTLGRVYDLSPSRIRSIARDGGAEPNDHDDQTWLINNDEWKQN